MVANDLLAVKVFKSVYLIMRLAPPEGCSYLNPQYCVEEGLLGGFSVRYEMSTWNVGRIEEMPG